MARTLRLGSWILCASLAAPHAHAGVLVVDASNGPFTSVQAAVDAAQPGDTLLVRTGTYDSFLVNAKPLSIVGDAGADVQISGAVRVRSLPAGTAFTLSNVSATGTPGTLPARHGLYLSDNLGAIRVANAFFTGAPGAGGTQRDGADGLFCELSPDVVATRCGFFGGQGLNGFESGVGKSGAGVRATSSTVALWDCVLEGGHGQHGSGQILDAGRGGHGLHATSAIAFLSGCFAYGGNGGNGAVPAFRWSIGGTGGHGLRLETGSIARLLEVHADGGQGGENWSGFGLTGYAADGLPRSGPGQFVDLYGQARELQAEAVVRDGATLSATLRGLPGDRIGLLLDRETEGAYVWILFGYAIVPFVRPERALLLGTLPASGEVTLALPIDWLEGSDVDELLHLQPLFREPGGITRLGSPLSIAVLDPAY